MHKLLVRVAEFWYEDGLHDEQFNDYHSISATPNAVHVSKEAHKEAVQELTDVLSSTDVDEVEEVAVSL